MKKVENFYLWLIAISGLSFWFSLGFPFANYYESYYWIGELNNNSFVQMIFQTTGHYSTYRPLGQLVIMILYKIASDSMFLIQLSSYILTISAIFIVIKSLDEKRIFSLVSLLIGGVLFSGFGYLFHLHGLYYTMVLLFLSSLFYYYRNTFSNRILIITSSVAFIASLFHPLALIFHIFYLIGSTIEWRKNLNNKQYIIIFSIITAEIILLLILSPGQKIYLGIDNLAGLMEIYKSFEMNKIITVFLILLSLFPVISLKIQKLNRIYLLTAVVILSAICVLNSLPILIVVAFTCSLKLIHTKRWAILSLLIATFFFTVFTDVQSGHLKVFVLFVLAYTIADDWKSLEDRLNFIKFNFSYSVVFIVALMIFLLRSDMKIPVLSKLSYSIFAKKESSYQLENVIAWYLKSDYRGNELLLFDNSVQNKNIECSENTDLNPTTNTNLHIYLNSLKREKKLNKNRKQKLYIYFNNCKQENFRLVHSIKGKYCKIVSVFLVGN